VPGYTLPDRRSLKNKLGATSHSELEKLEAVPVKIRLLQISEGRGPSGRFDAAYLKAIHAYLFQDVFEWAGRTRDERVLLSDGSTATEPLLAKLDGQPFLAGPAIPRVLAGIFEALARANYLRGLSREVFAERAADLLSDLNSVHPFREGNGRTQRSFLTAVAVEAGHGLDFSVISRERMVQASIAASDGDRSMMRRMFEEISDPSRVANLRKGIGALERLRMTGASKLDWNSQYVATARPGQPDPLVLAGISGEQFMARTQTAILFGNTRDLPEPRPGRGESFMLAGPGGATAPQLDIVRRSIAAFEQLDRGLSRRRLDAQQAIVKAAEGLADGAAGTLTIRERATLDQARAAVAKRRERGPGLDL
jgi:cell filamentation protein